MADKFMYIPNDNTQNYLFCRLQLVIKCLDTQPTEPTKKNKKSQKLSQENVIIKLW